MAAAAATSPRIRAAAAPDVVLGVVVVAVGVALPFLVGTGKIPTLIAGVFALYLAYSWNIVGGILGELSLVHMIFWGAGGYALVLAFTHGQTWELWVAAAVAGSALGAVLVVLTATALRLVGLYLAVFTLIVHELARSVVNEVQYLGAGVGLYMTGSSFWTQRTVYFVGFALVCFCAGVNFLVLSRPIGLRWLTLRDDPIAAQSIGVNPTREKSVAYALSAALAAIGGAFQAYYLGYAQPDATLSLSALIAAILAVYVGGPGTKWGPFLGVLVVFGLGQIAAAYSTSADVALYAQLLQYVASFLVIRFVTSRVQSGDLVSTVFAHLRQRRRPPAGEPDLPPPVRLVPRDRHEHAPPLLSLSDVSKHFGGLRVLESVSFDLQPGTITALVGPNGAGKTTLCNIISGFIKPSGGSVRLAGDAIASLPPHARFRLGVGRTFQTPRLCGRLSLLQNVAAAAAGDTDAARRALRRVGIDDPSRIAGTSDLYQRRLTEVARAVVGADRVVLLDEPLVGLAHEQQEATLGLMRELADSGLAVLIVEHLIPVVAPAADRMIVLVGGGLIADSTPSLVLEEPAVIDAYLGEPLEVPA